MNKEIKISDWVTEEEFNYSPTGELSAVLYLAEQRSEWFAKGEKAAEERIIKLLEDDFWHHISFATRSPDEEPTNYHDGECLGCRLIEAIKGEKK